MNRPGEGTSVFYYCSENVGLLVQSRGPVWCSDGRAEDNDMNIPDCKYEGRRRGRQHIDKSGHFCALKEDGNPVWICWMREYDNEFLCVCSFGLERLSSVCLFSWFEVAVEE